MADYLPNTDLELQAWAANFIAVAGSHADALGLPAAAIPNLQAQAARVSADLLAAFAAHAAATAAVQIKNADTKTMLQNVRALVNTIQAQPTVPDNLKALLGITVRAASGVSTPPITPTALVAEPHASGVNTLSWKTMGNKGTTQYVVYAKAYSPAVSLDAEAGWNMVGQTTRGRFDHRGVTAGQPLAYKIVAARARQVSSPSLPVTVYVS